MKRIKKELPKVILFYLIGMAIVMLMCWNTEHYDKNHSQSNSYVKYETLNK